MANPEVLLYRAKMTARILLAMGSAAVLALVARLTGVPSINLPIGKSSLADIWVFFFAASAAHLFWTAFTIDATRDLLRNASDKVCKETFEKLRTEESLLLNGLIPRARLKGKSSIVKMSLGDPTTWIAYGLALVSIAAILPWSHERGKLVWLANGGQLVTIAIFAGALLVFNWLSASAWIATLSQLSVPSNERWPEKGSFWNYLVGSTALPTRTVHLSSRYLTRLRILGVLIALAGIPLVVLFYGPR